MPVSGATGSVSESVVVAVVLGALQGVLEWLPVSSEGNVAVALAALGESPTTAVLYGLFLHAGTAVSATAYYREEFADVARTASDWRPASAFAGETATLTYLVVATLTSGLVGVVAFLALESLVSALTGGAFVALVGGLLVATGVLQRVAGGTDVAGRGGPDAVDAVVVGALQGLAVLPGVSRSGTTASALLLRGHEGEAAFRLSFLLSVPAALGAAGLAVVEHGGLPSVAPLPALVAVVTAAVVGYLSIDVLLRAVRRLAFWAVCVALGALAVLGGVLVVLA
jgi:undecaprenyl-diphosphatase